MNNYNYYIEGCPIPFHDLPELFDYLKHTGKLLYQYQFLTVYCGNYPCFWIIIERNYSINVDFITYRDYPRY